MSGGDPGRAQQRGRTAQRERTTSPARGDRARRRRAARRRALCRARDCKGVARRPGRATADAGHRMSSASAWTSSRRAARSSTTTPMTAPGSARARVRAQPRARAISSRGDAPSARAMRPDAAATVSARVIEAPADASRRDEPLLLRREFDETGRAPPACRARAASASPIRRSVREARPCRSHWRPGARVRSGSPSGRTSRNRRCLQRPPTSASCRLRRPTHARASTHRAAMTAAPRGSMSDSSSSVTSRFHACPACNDVRRPAPSGTAPAASASSHSIETRRPTAAPEPRSRRRDLHALAPIVERDERARESPVGRDHSRARGEGALAGNRRDRASAKGERSRRDHESTRAAAR